VKVEIWSDVACPWCLVGTERFERAVEQTGIDVDVVYRSFELDPRVPRGEAAPPLRDYLVRKFGGTEQVAAAHSRLDAAASQLGFEFAWDRMRRSNTFDAHRLLLWALRVEGSAGQRRLKKALLRSYFTDGADVGDHEVLLKAVDRAGLDRASAAGVLASDEGAEEVRQQRAEAHRSGINAVPTFIVEGEWMLQGAMETERWVKALTHISAELEERASRALLPSAATSQGTGSSAAT